MRSRAALLALLVAVAAGCGGQSAETAAEVRACVAKRLPPGSVDRVSATTEQGVTTLNYVHRGSETMVTIFKSEADAEAAEKAEARLGDAHDRRVGNALYSGGGAAERAIVACLR